MQRRHIYLALGITALMLVMAAGVAFFTWRAAKKTFVETVLTPKEEEIDLSRIVTQVRELNRLETASMRVVHVGKVSQSYKMVPNAIAGDEITFLATGDVIAGYDLSRLTANDIWRSPDGTVTLRLPHPEVLVTRIDNEQSRVINRDTGVLRRGDEGLETRARQFAESNVRDEALKKGILNLAKQNGEKRLAELLLAVGVQKVRFVQSTAAPPAPAER